MPGWVATSVFYISICLNVTLSPFLCAFNIVWFKLSKSLKCLSNNKWKKLRNLYHSNPFFTLRPKTSYSSSWTPNLLTEMNSINNHWTTRQMQRKSDNSNEGYCMRAETNKIDKQNTCLPQWCIGFGRT